LTLEELEVIISAQTAPLKKQLDSVKTQLKGLQNTTNSTNNQIASSFSALASKLGKFAGFAGVAYLAKQALNEIKKDIAAAMDVTESENLFEVSMGNMANAAREWSNSLQDSLGLNAFEVRKNVGVLYNMTTSMGIAREQAYGLSTNLTQLAYDMASFYNISNEEAFVKLRAGITGETEPLKALGILVDEGTSKQVAYQMGIAKTGEELTQQQKVMARYQAILMQTGNAQGDLARTIDSPANQLRLLRTQLALLRINLGQAFLPIVQVVLPILTSFIKGLNVVLSAVAGFMKALFGVETAQSGLGAAAIDTSAAQGGLADSLTNTGSAAEKAAKKAKGALATFDEINQLNFDNGDSGGGGGSAGGGVGSIDMPSMDTTPFETTIPKALKDLADKVRPSLEKLGKSFQYLGEKAYELWKVLEPYVMPVLKALGELAWKFFETSVNLLGDAFYFLGDGLEFVAGIISGDFEKTFSGLSGIAWDAIEAVKDVINPFLDIYLPGTAPYFNNFVDIMRTSFDEGIEVIKGFNDPAKLEIQDFVDTGKQLFELFKTDSNQVWANTWNMLMDKLKEKDPEMYTKIMEMRDKWGGLFLQARDKFPTTWGDMWNLIRNKVDQSNPEVFSRIDTIVNGVAERFNNMKTRISQIMDGVKTAISISWDGAVFLIKTKVNNLIQKINSGIASINSLDLPSVNIPFFGDIGGRVFNIPNIPYLAKGGIIDSPTLAMVGEAGKEAVVPLENTSFTQNLASELGNAVMSALQISGGGNGSPIDLTINFGSQTVFKKIIDGINSVNAAAGKNLITI
jgi:hypothetical protein